MKSLHQNIASQDFTHTCGFAEVYHTTLANGENIGHTLIDFIHEFGAPVHLTCDGTTVQVGKRTKFQKTLQNPDTKRKLSNPRYPNENPAEGIKSLVLSN